MSEVKRFKPVINDKPYKPYARCEESEDGTYVRLADYAELKAQRDTLAAENAALQSVIEAVRGVAGNSEGIAGWHLNGDIAQWGEILPEIDDIETPATDAYLNSVRADAIESVLDALASSGALTVGDSIVEVVKLAEGLRAGKDGE